jgi:tetratricopeptide (TPR) repeat protein
MLVQAAEESFRQGMTAYEAGRGREAMAFFEAAIKLEKRFGATPPQARYLSQYGLCLGTVMQRKHEGVRYCKEAAHLETYNADIQCNLGRVLLAAGLRKEAYRAFISGLRMDAGHGGIVRELKQMGMRRRSVLPFLARDNRLNIILGRMRNGG